MLYTEEVLKNLNYSDCKDLKNSVYTEYLQYLISKFICNIKSVNPFYLFGSFYNRIRYGMNRLGNSLDFFSKRKTSKDYKIVNDILEQKLKLEGYEVTIAKISKSKFEFIISSDKILNLETGKEIKFKIYINYFSIVPFFKQSIFKGIVSSFHLNQYGINTKICSLLPELSLTILLRKIYLSGIIEPIELYDIFQLAIKLRQICEHNLFDKNDLNKIRKTLIKAEGNLGNKKIRNVNSDSYKVVGDITLDKFFDFNSWVNEINI